MYSTLYIYINFVVIDLFFRYKEFFAREYSSSRARDWQTFDVPPSFSSSNPQPNQAKRFLRQAQEDLRAADNDYEPEEPAYEWVCFKAHQVRAQTFNQNIMSDLNQLNIFSFVLFCV